MQFILPKLDIPEFEEYTKGALTTAQFPILSMKTKDGKEVQLPWEYPFHGLCGESAETFLLVKCDKQQLERNEVKKELGDMLWYIAILAQTFGFTAKVLDNLLDVAGSELVRDLRVHVENREIYLDEIFDKLMISNGRIAERLKKVMRDRDGVPNTDDIRSIAIDLTLCLACWYMICSVYKFIPQSVAEDNLEKLRSRKERGVISGDGGNR